MSAPASRSKAETEPVSAKSARHIVRLGMTATLATLEASNAAPHASLVSVVTTPSGAPVMAMSSLSHHHGNIAGDDRISLLFTAPGALGNPLERGRVTVSGTAFKTRDDTIVNRFMARHPEAFYTGFEDFGFYEINIVRVHYVAGFGRVRWFNAKSFLVGGELAAAERDIVEHMNTDHADVISLCVAAFGGTLVEACAGPWRMCGVDVEGMDLICDGLALRIDFAEPALTADAARQQLIGLARKAREVSA